MKRYTLLICLCLGIQFYTQGQYSEYLTSDRAGQTLLPYTVGKNVIQAQTGFTRTEFDYLATVWNHANLQLRYGLFEKFEIYGSFGIINNHIGDSPFTWERGSSNERAYGYGLRVNLFEGNGALPAVGVQADYNRSFDMAQLNLILLLRSDFGEKFALGSNVIFEIDGYVGATLKPEFYPIEKLGIFAEGTVLSTHLFDQDRIQDFVEYGWTAGAMYRINSEFMVDASVGEQWISTTKFNFFVDFGLNYRFDWRK